MALEHIGRKQSIGLGKESTSGTSVAASVWIPKMDGKFVPENTAAKDEGAYGVIDMLREQQTVKTVVSTDFSAMIRDGNFPYILQALYGASYPCVRFPIPGSITGTYVLGETITETTSSATGTLRRADTGGTSIVLFIQPVSGTFQGAKLLTGGTSGATATGGTIESPASVRYHINTLANTNTHSSYTIYGSDPVGDFKSVYSMLDTLSVECVAGNWGHFKSTWKGKKIASASAQSPSYTKYPGFLAKYANFYNANTYALLDGATATAIKSLKLNFKKNLTDYQAWGSTDVNGFFNKQFEVSGQLVLLYNTANSGWRDYVTNSTKQAFRITLSNTDAAAYGSATQPTVQFDFPVVSFQKFDRTNNNNDIVEATLDFMAEWDPTTSMTSQAFVANNSVSQY